MSAPFSLSSLVPTSLLPPIDLIQLNVVEPNNNNNQPAPATSSDASTFNWSVVTCGIQEDGKNERTLSQYCEYFGKSVPVFTAVKDPLQQTLYKSAEIANKLGCQRNRLSMYLIRHKYGKSSIYQASGFQTNGRLHSSCRYLKIGSYFLSMEACREFENYVNRNPFSRYPTRTSRKRIASDDDDNDNDDDDGCSFRRPKREKSIEYKTEEAKAYEKEEKEEKQTQTLLPLFAPLPLPPLPSLPSTGFTNWPQTNPSPHFHHYTTVNGPITLLNPPNYLSLPPLSPLYNPFSYQFPFPVPFMPPPSGNFMPWLLPPANLFPFPFDTTSFLPASLLPSLPVGPVEPLLTPLPAPLLTPLPTPLLTPLLAPPPLKPVLFYKS